MLKSLTEKDFKEYLKNTDFGEKLKFFLANRKQKSQNSLFMFLKFLN